MFILDRDSLEKLAKLLGDVSSLREEILNTFEGRMEWKSLEEIEEYGEEDKVYIGIDGSTHSLSFRGFKVSISKAVAFSNGLDSLVSLQIMFPAGKTKGRGAMMMSSLENLLASYELRKWEKGRAILLMDGSLMAGIFLRLLKLNRIAKENLESLADSETIKSFLEDCKSHWDKCIKIEEREIEGRRKKVISSESSLPLNSSLLDKESLKNIVEGINPKIPPENAALILENLECLLTYDRLLEAIKEREATAIYLAKGSYSSILIKNIVEGSSNGEDIEERINIVYLTDYLVINELSRGRTGFLSISDPKLEIDLYKNSTLYKILSEEEKLNTVVKKYFPKIYELYRKFKGGFSNPEEIDQGSLSDLEKEFFITYARLSPQGRVHRIEILNGEFERSMRGLVYTLGSKGYPYHLLQAHRKCKLSKREVINIWKLVINQLRRRRPELSKLLDEFKSSRDVLGE